MRLINALAVLEGFPPAFHDLCQVRYGISVVEITQGLKFRLLLLNCSQDDRLFDIAQNR